MDYKVSSELYSESNNTVNVKPIILQDNVVSIFKFLYPTFPKLDSDGDFDLEQHEHADNEYKEIIIEHSISTTLKLVGLQIWRGAFLLADWFICNSKRLPANCKVLELGSGVGLTSIVAAIYRPVLCTDINDGEILELLKKNISQNKSLTQFPVVVHELDFFSQNFDTNIVTALPDVKIILAADVIYDNDITYAFVSTLRRLLLLSSPECTAYIALEKRYVFLTEDLNTCAPCYEYFLECIWQYNDIQAHEVTVDFPQYFIYQRCKELVMWKITKKVLVVK